ncbi:hypothetical protein [Burkholderia vietnamiensis]|uniref:hypothetical protein n=1 Tax=Burkholderia vietnamiensis TaxID=60552 RepID=UPI001CF0DFEB|nr:hypothetical protein [Burkholderia vietnamiensis]MCA8228162.1 hypothetical protein [Burkholderia vietnamiensis]UEC05556.1 hypothetical protein LK462_34535 [Burkholderia vietnamiensis]
MLARPFTPDEFRALIRWKGWSHKELASYWQVSAVHVSRIVNDTNRAPHWNDAVMGLPRRSRMISDLASRYARATRLAADAGLPDGCPADDGRRRVGRPPAPRAPAIDDVLDVQGAGSGYRHRGYVVVGSILTLDHDLGDSLLEGTRGIVFEVTDTGVGERYGVIFENGEYEWFLPTHLDSGLTGTGLDAEGLGQYVFSGTAQLTDDFNRGRFQFW